MLPFNFRRDASAQFNALDSTSDDMAEVRQILNDITNRHDNRRKAGTNEEGRQLWVATTGAGADHMAVLYFIYEDASTHDRDALIVAIGTKADFGLDIVEEWENE